MRNHTAATALVAVLLVASTAPAHAIGCDELRDGIAARIRAGGVSNFSLTVVAAGAAAPGSVVGSCELGTRKIYYVKGAASAAGSVAVPAAKPAASASPRAVATPAPAALAAKPKAAPVVITECDDGNSVTHGECKK